MSDLVRRGDPPARRGELVKREPEPPAKRDALARQELPSELREAILEAVAGILEVLPPQVSLDLRFGAAVEHGFDGNGYVRSLEQPLEVTLSLCAEAPMPAETPAGWPKLIAGLQADGHVIARDGELDLVLVGWSWSASVAHPRRAHAYTTTFEASTEG